jgi:hypothetical protein
MRMRCVGHAEYMGDINVDEGMNRSEIWLEGMDSIQLAQNRIQRQASVNVAAILLFP